MDFKLIIFGNDIYKEVELDASMEAPLYIGTAADSQIRFNRDNFFADFDLSVANQNGQWVMNCKHNIYLKKEASVKQYFELLEHGDRIDVFYENADVHIFRVEFLMDYERRVTPYTRYVDIKHQDEIYIGGHASCQIIIDDAILQQDYICLKRCRNGYILDDSHSRYGIMVNGFKAILAYPQINYGDFFSLLGTSFYITENRLYYTGQGSVQSQWPILNDDLADHVYAYPKFTRNARIRFKLPDTSIEVLPPKSMPQAPEKNLIMTIIPVIATLVLTVVLRGVMGGGGSFIIYSAAMMIMGGVMSVWNYLNDGKAYKEAMKKRTAQYNDYVTMQAEKIAALRDKERHILDQKYLSLEDDIQIVRQFDLRLYERQKGDDDFLSVYLGRGIVESCCPVKYRNQEYKDTEDELQDYPQLMYDRFRYLDNVPVVIDLKAVNAVGITGSRSRLYQMLKNMTLDITVRHFYQDVKLYYILTKADANAFRWMRWLRHAWNDETETRNFMYDEDSEKNILEYLYGELSGRESLDLKYIPLLPRVIVFVYRSNKLMLHPLSRFIDNAGALGFTFLFFEEHRELLPPGCDEFIYLNDGDYTGMVQSCQDGDRIRQFNYSHIPAEICSQTALKLSCVYVDEVSLESSLTRNISLFKLMGIMTAAELDLAERWNKSRIYESMAAPIGVKSGDEIICLDLHEKFHGPHGLVAGTTGSGKSEVLQTYILSMATLFHPYEVSFVIIDFKGGGMVNQFKELPHINGAITNIDGREINRSLLSIKAELRKRQALFAQYGVNHIDAYIQLYKKRETPIPLPHLILIVDEFAELKMDQPEFMKELISAARIGRSLGVHLILATQKPSGVVDAQIWSNSKFKLCLKVQNREDSNEVLKSPLASEIREPGRAYLQVGNNEIFTLFQSAYSGAPVNVDDNQRKFEISRVTLSGKRIPVYVKKTDKGSGKNETQLDALVKYINAYCQKENIQKLPGICLPPLKDMLPYPDQFPCRDQRDTVIPLGIYDDPDHQRQAEVMMNLSAGHVLIIGASQYGKTNVLQLMLRAIAESYRPDEVWMYILDFGSMALKVFESLRHVGGVVLSSEDEKLKNLMKMLTGELKRRKEVFSGMGITSFGSYREAGHQDLAHILVFLDNFLAFKELYPDYEDTLLTLCREGVALGITLIFTSLQTSGISYRYMSNMPNRICLYCNQKDEYGNVFDHCRQQPSNIPGRGLIALEKEIFEYQGYLAFDGEKEIDRVNSMKRVITQINEASGSLMAARIPMVPEVLTEAVLTGQFGVKRSGTYQAALGIDYENIRVFAPDLEHLGVLGLLGDSEATRQNFVCGIMYHLYLNMFSAASIVYILDDAQKRLKRYENCGIVDRYCLDGDDIIDLIEEIHGILQERMEAEPAKTQGYPLLVLFIENREAISILSKNAAAMKLYREITGKYKNYGICIIYTNIEDAQLSFSGPEILKLLKEQRHLMYFDDLSAMKFIDVPNQVLRTYKKELAVMDAYYFQGGNVLKVKTVKCSEEWMEQWQ